MAAKGIPPPCPLNTLGLCLGLREKWKIWYFKEGIWKCKCILALSWDRNYWSTKRVLKNLCMRLKPTHIQGSITVEGIKATRYFQALRHWWGGKKILKIIDETHYTTQTHTWHRLAWSSEFQHKNVWHAADPWMGRSNTEARIKIGWCVQWGPAMV